MKKKDGDNVTFEFIKHTKNYLSANLAVGLVSFLILPILTRLISPAEYGNISLFLSVVSALTLILGLGLGSAIKVNDIKETFDKRKYFSSVINLLLILNILLSLILVLLREPISKWLSIPQELILFGIIASALNVFIGVYLKLTQVRKQSVRHNIIYTLQESFVPILAIVIITLIPDLSYKGWIYSTIVVYTFLTFSEIKRIFLFKF